MVVVYDYVLPVNRPIKVRRVGMLFQGKSLSAQLLDDGIVEFKFDAQGSVNKFDQATFKEYIAVVDAINNCSEAKGVLVTSGKSSFIVGADITEFLETFKNLKKF